MRYEMQFNKLAEKLAPILRTLDYQKIGRSNKALLTQASEDPFSYFVTNEWASCEVVLAWYEKNVPRGAKVLDVGTFTGAIPLLLAWAGYKVTTIEKYDWYGDGFNPLIGYLRSNGIEVIDADITSDIVFKDTFDVVQMLAVVEHLHGSPLKVLTTLKGALSPAGRMMISVPNQARLGKRIQLIMGDSTMPSYIDYLQSSYPFTGHHREYTFSEMKVLMSELDFHSFEMSSIRYPGDTLSKKLINFCASFLPRTFHQMIFCVAKN